MSELSSLNTSVLFTNWTREDFSYKWGGKSFTFPARSSENISVGTREHNEGLAKHFAKHLVDRELNRRGVPTDHFSRTEFEKNCFVSLAESAPVPVHKVTLHQDTGLVQSVEKVGTENPLTGVVSLENEPKPETVAEVVPPVAPVVEKKKKPTNEDADKNSNFVD